MEPFYQVQRDDDGRFWKDGRFGCWVNDPSDADQYITLHIAKYIARKVIAFGKEVNTEDLSIVERGAKSIEVYSV